MSKHTLKSITDLYKATFFTTDDAAIALIAAILIGSQLKVPPVWCHIIGPTSGGKSTLLEAFNKHRFVHQISDLTPNTFLSGMATSKGETSLLRQLGPCFTIFMKDFTTILSKPDDTQEAIIAQMREIYDGYISKQTGLGKKIEWPGPGLKGHATFVMAATEGIYSLQDKFSDMGTRAINYVLLPQDRKASTKRGLRNNGKLEGEMENIQLACAEFVEEMFQSLPEQLPYIDEQLENDIVDVADLASLCRSVIKRDYKGAKSLALSAEMPMRMSKQFLVIAQLFIHISGGVLPDNLRAAIFKTAFDSIPKQRRLILEAMSKFNRVTIAGVADLINYPPERCKEWMEDLQMFKVIDRIKAGHKQYYALREEYREIITKHLHIINTGSDLETDSDGGAMQMGGGNYQDVPFEVVEAEAAHAQAVDAEFNSLGM